MDPIVQIVGVRLRAARQRAGLTIRAAAAAAGIDHTALVRYENGTMQPSLVRLAALASVYGVTPAALLVTSDAVAELVTLFERADAEQLVELEVLLRGQQR